MAKRRNFTDQFKAKMAFEALRGDKAVQEIAAKHQLNPNQVSTWKRQAIEGMAAVFSGGKQSGRTEAEVKELQAKIGRLQCQSCDSTCNYYVDKIMDIRTHASHNTMIYIAFVS